MDDAQIGLHHDRQHLALVGLRIRELRVERGYSQESFALKVGLARSYYGAIERGEKNFSIVLLLRIAGGLRVEAGTLLPHVLSNFSADDYEALGKELEIAEATSEPEHTQKLQETQVAGGARYISAGAAAKLLSVNRRTIARWVAAGILEAEFVEDSNGTLVTIFRREALLKRQASR